MKRAAAQVGAAAIVVAIAGYVAQFVAARWLGPADYTRFAVFWSLLFIMVGTLSGIAQELIRVSRVAKLRLDDGIPPNTDDRRTPRIGVIAMGVGVCTTIVVGLTGFLWGPLAFGADWRCAIGLLSLACIFFSCYVAVSGTAAGLARWRSYALLVVVEGIARIGFFVVAAFVLPTVIGFSIAAILAFAPNFLLGVLWAPLRRQSFSVRSDAPVGQSTTRILRAMVASGISGILVIGWPALLSLAANVNPRGSTAVSLGVLILVVTLTRAPLMVPLTSFQNALVARFTGLDLHGRRRWVAVGAGFIVVASGVLALPAALLGPLLLPLVFGAQYHAGAAIVAALTAATAGLGIITLTGVASITAARHSLYLTGWGVAIIVALLVLFLAPVPFEWATVLALVIGPLAGATVQLVTLRPVKA